MIKELSINFEAINDDIVIDTFSHPTYNSNVEYIYDFDGWVGIDASHRTMKNEEVIDKAIYKALSKLYKSK